MGSKLEDIQGNVNEDAGRTDPRDWIGERDHEGGEGAHGPYGAYAEQYLRCPQCGGMASETRGPPKRYECEECGHESYEIQLDLRY